MKVIGLLIMVIFGVAAGLISLTVQNSADVLLILACGSLSLCGAILWYKKRIGLVATGSLLLITVLCLFLFGIVLPDQTDQRTLETEEQLTHQPPLSTSGIDGTQVGVEQQPELAERILYIGNSQSRVYHRLECESVRLMKDYNKIQLSSVAEAMDLGLAPAGDCQP